MQSNQSEIQQVDLSQYAYTHNLARVEAAAQDGRLDEIPGYTEYCHFPTFGFDLLECAFVEGGTDMADVETKLVQSYGEEYSLRYTILELAAKQIPANAK
jgi:hypothetical protein